MSSLTWSEWQGLGATFVAAPLLIISVEKLMASAVGGDLGILLGSVIGAVVFGLVPVVAARTIAHSVPATQLQPLSS